MSSVIISKIASQKNSYAGRSWYYNFKRIPKVFIEGNSIKVVQGLSKRYSALTKSWDKDVNSEWICRIYLSAKMIMTATLQLNALKYANSRNLRLVSPYLVYYSLLSLIRGIVYTLPEVKWESGKLVEISHRNAINLAIDHIASFDKTVAGNIKMEVLKAKAFRELIAYRAPSSGDLNIVLMPGIEEVAMLLAEVAQFNSEIFESSVIKNSNKSDFIFIDSYISDLSTATIEGITIVDDEDLYRLGYLKRKYPLPPNVLHIMSEGHVEDFFGAWCMTDDLDSGFDPDKGWGLIFDIP